VDCAEIRDALLARETPSGPSVEEHLATCPGCRELLADHAELGKGLASARDPETEGPEFSALERRLTKERGLRAWLRSRPTIVRVAASIWCLLLVLTFFVLAARRVDWELYPALRLNLIFAGFALGAFVTIELSLRGPLRYDRKLHTALALVALVLPVGVALLPRAHLLHDASLEGTIRDFGGRALRCAVIGLLASAPLALLIHLFGREDKPTKLTAALAAAAAGLAANLCLQAHCAITDPDHLLVGHALLGLVWLGAFLAVARFSRAR
jgi:predicted anti-sigma-YlaC factor YlaD